MVKEKIYVSDGEMDTVGLHNPHLRKGSVYTY